jgi:autotransporter-associated beta strand protein
MSELHRPLNTSSAVTVTDFRNSNFICSATQVDGMSAWLSGEGVAYLASNQSFTGNNTFTKNITVSQGAILTSQPNVFSQTWNDGAVTFDAFSIDITNTASAAASRGFRVRVDGSTIFSVRKDGQTTIVAGGLEVNSGSVNVYSGNIYVSGSFFTAAGAVSFSYQGNYSGSMVCTSFPGGSPYAWSGIQFNTTRTADLTLAGNFTDIGLTIDNDGAAGAVDIDLPNATPGLWYALLVTDAQSLGFTATNGNQIRDDTTLGSVNGRIHSSTVGHYVKLYCAKNGIWTVVAKRGSSWTLT